MDELRFRVGVIGIAIILAFSAFFMYMQQAAIQSAVDSSSEDRYHQNPDDFLPVFDENEKLWKEALKLITDGRYGEAFVTYGRAASFEYSMLGGENIEVHPGVKAREAFKKEKDQFAKAALQAFEKVTKQAVQTPLESWRFQEFAGRFMDVSPEIRRLFEARRKEVVGARIREAGKWFRLSFAATDKAYAQPIMDTLRERWNQAYGKTLVFGDVLDPAELAATWMTLEVKFQESGATYEVKSHQYNRLIPVTVPESVRAVFTLRKRIPIPTTWDALPPIQAFTEAPGVITGEAGALTDRVEQVAGEQRDKLAQEIVTKVVDIPTFELYPGRKIESLALVSGGRLDREAARILGAVDPDRLAREALVLSNGPDQTLAAELLETAIEQDLDALGPWAATQIATMAEERLPHLLILLRPRPSFGGFQPVLAVLNRTTDDARRLEILDLLKRFLYEESVYQAFLRVISDRKNPLRLRAAPLFFGNIPPERLDSCSVWMNDPDPQFVSQIHQAITRPDSPLRDQAFGLMLVGSPPETQMRLLMDFHYQEEKHGKSVIEKLQLVCRQASTPEVRRLALEKLMYETSNTPHGWTALENLLPVISDPEMQGKAREALATNVGRAHPEKAREFQLKAILSGSAEERTAAAHKYFRSDGDIDEKLAAIVPHLNRYQKEDQFFEALLRGMSENGMSRLKDPRHPQLRQMLVMAVAHAKPMVRYFGYSLCHRAWKDGATDLREVLQSGLARDTDSWSKKQGESLLAAIDQDTASGDASEE